MGSHFGHIPEPVSFLVRHRFAPPGVMSWLPHDRNVFGSMMVQMGAADSLVSGVTQHYPDTIRPALQIVRIREGLHRVCGCYVLITRKGEIFFLADTSVNIEPTAEDLVEIALCTAHMARRFDIVP